MSTVTEFDLDYQHFQRFVDALSQKGDGPTNLEEALHRYREYQQEVEKLRGMLQPAYERYLSGEFERSDANELRRFILENREPLS
ncbi:hypothetical protein [Lacunimicrobium album]